MERALIARRLLPCKHEHGLSLIYLCLVGADLCLLDRYLHARLGLLYRRYESSKQAAREVNLMRTDQRITPGLAVKRPHSKAEYIPKLFVTITGCNPMAAGGCRTPCRSDRPKGSPIVSIFWPSGAKAGHCRPQSLWTTFLHPTDRNILCSQRFTVLSRPPISSDNSGA
jgi:hypothetical protein